LIFSFEFIVIAVSLSTVSMSAGAGHPAKYITLQSIGSGFSSCNKVWKVGKWGNFSRRLSLFRALLPFIYFDCLGMLWIVDRYSWWGRDWRRFTEGNEIISSKSHYCTSATRLNEDKA